MKLKVVSQLLWLSNVAHSFLLNIYCGDTNCYKVLGVKKMATNIELTEAFNKIELRYNPEKSRNGDKVLYNQALKAYNVLINEEQRKDYDIMIDDPYNLPQNYYFYFKHSVLPNVDIQRLVVFSIIVVSIIQYFYKKHTYTRAVQAAMSNTKNRNQCLHKLQEERILQGHFKKLSYREEEKVLRQMVEKSLVGKFSKSKLTDTLFIQILYAPYYFFFHNVKPCARWINRQGFFNEEYEDMPTYEDFSKFNADDSNESVTTFNDSSDESRLRLRMWLNGSSNEIIDDNDSNNNEKNSQDNASDDKLR